LGNYPQDETAMAITDCAVVHFTVPEFEKLAAGNSRIIMKMLQVFSTQLRRIHHQVQSQLAESEAVSPEAGLFAVGEYYLNDGQYPQAGYAFKRYLNHWPRGIYAPQATLKAREAEAAEVESPEEVSEEHDSIADYSALSFTEINNLFKRGRFKDALKGFLSIIRDGRDQEHLAYAELRVGCCLYHVEQYGEATKHLAQVIRKYPKHPNLAEAVYYMGLSHRSLGEKDKAVGFLKKAGAMAPEGGSLYRTIVKTIRELGEQI
jgi:TolA-binding protein